MLHCWKTGTEVTEAVPRCAVFEWGGVTFDGVTISLFTSLLQHDLKKHVAHMNYRLKLFPFLT